MPVKKATSAKSRQKAPAKRKSSAKRRNKRRKIAPWRKILRNLFISVIAFIILVYLLVFLKAQFL